MEFLEDVVRLKESQVILAMKYLLDLELACSCFPIDTLSRQSSSLRAFPSFKKSVIQPVGLRKMIEGHTGVKGR